TDRDRADAPPIVVINQAMADHRWPGENPIGKRVRPDLDAPWREVVGIVENVREYGLDQAVRDQVYVPVAQFSGLSESLIVGTQGDPQLLVPALRDAIASVDPLLAVDQVQTVQYFME